MQIVFFELVQPIQSIVLQLTILDDYREDHRNENGDSLWLSGLSFRGDIKLDLAHRNLTSLPDFSSGIIEVFPQQR